VRLRVNPSCARSILTCMNARTPVIRVAQHAGDAERSLMLVMGWAEAYPEQQVAPDDLLRFGRLSRTFKRPVTGSSAPNRECRPE
jgi:hypothetical protein